MRGSVLDESTIFKTFWYGPELSPYEYLCLKSFVDYGHRIQLFSYGSVNNLPVGVEERDASEIFPESSVFLYPSGKGKGSVSAFSNVFRYKLLFLEGGFWIDTDVICLSESVPDTAVFFGFESQDKVNSALLKFPPGHPVISECLRRAKQVNPTTIRWGDTGPKLVTQVIKEHEALDQAYSSSFSYPVSPGEATDLLRPSKAAVIDSQLAKAPFLHLWNENLRGSAIRKEVAPPAGSLLEIIASRHNVFWNASARYDEITVNQLQELANLRHEVQSLRKLAKFQVLRRGFRSTRHMLKSVQHGFQRIINRG